MEEEREGKRERSNLRWKKLCEIQCVSILGIKFRYRATRPKMSFISVSPLTLVLGGVIAALACVVLLVHFRSSKKSKSKQSYKSLPGPKGLPVLGASYIVGRYPKPWDAFSALRKQYGDIYGLTLGSRRCVVVSNMALVKEVLVTKCHDFANRPDFLRFHAIFRGDRNL
ncbi:cytochrome P450 307a1, partial [Caerostris extrusa]